MEHTKDKGDLAEAAVLKRLKSLGYVVLTPFGDNARYDLAYDDGEDLHRVQVKWGRLDDGVIKFATSSHNRDGDGGHVYRTYGERDVDEFMVYCHRLDEVYAIPVADSPKWEMYLRVDSPDNGQADGVNFADGYVL